VRLLIIVLLFPLYTVGQDTLKLSLDNSISGMYTTQNNINTTNLTYSGNNTIFYNKFQLNTTSNYQLGYSLKSLTNNEFLEKTNISRNSLFFSHIYTSSLSRKIISDNSIGFGYSHKWNISKFILGLSYALLYQNTNYSTKLDLLITRHSARFKLRYTGSIVSFMTELYFQPNTRSLFDKIIYGTTKLSIKPKNRLSLTIQDAINYRSLSSVKLIHTLTVGLSYQFETVKYFNLD
jgi:hypothetical protein